MKPKEILRTIEAHLGLKPIKMPRIKVDPKYLRGMGTAAVIKDKTGLTMIVKDKNKLERIDEELTHIADISSDTLIQTKEDEDSQTKKYKNCFYNNVLMEALGYYGSKLIAPKRKPIKIRQEGLKENIEKKDWKKLGNTYKGDLDLDRRTWHEIGYDLGEKIYYYVQKTHDKKPALGIILKNRYKEKPFEVYKRILEQVTK